MTAVFVEEGRSFVYLQAQADSPEFVRRGIETVAMGSERVRVVSGLSAGDRIVSEGVLLLRQLEADAPRP
jgi:hypothetical protein